MMLKKCIAVIALLGFSGSQSVIADADQKTQRVELDVSDAQNISLNVPVGKVVVTGVSGNKLSAEVKASCKDGKGIDEADCHEALKELDWSKKIGKATELGLLPDKISRFEDIQVEVKVNIPSDKKLDVTLYAGDLSLQGTGACVNASLNAGQLNLKLKESQLALAELSAKVGDVKLTDSKGETMSGERSILVGSDLIWNKGAGSCQAKASVIAGEVHLTLY